MITRTNYEEFFLLYIDNELSAADRQRVEAFVAGNPDLEEEWEALLQCRMLPEEEEQPVFGNKGSLMRFVGEATGADKGPIDGDRTLLPINDDNYSDYFLSYIDGELGVKDRQLVENFLRLHPSKGTELEKWRQTISRPDPADLFPDKESLYRKETGKRILFPWWRVAAAAVILGVIGWSVFHSAASVTPGNITAPPLAQTTHKKSDGQKASIPVTPATPPALYSAGSGTGPAVTARTVENKKGTAIPVPTQGSKAALPEEKTPAPVVAKTTVEKITHRDDNAIAAADPGTVPGKDAIPETISRENSSFATRALLQSSTASPEDDNIETEPASVKKNKLRGIFRRVSRAFEKTADREDDGQRKVLIGAFQVSL